MGLLDRYLTTTMYLDNAVDECLQHYDFPFWDDILPPFELIDEAWLKEISDQNEKFLLALADEQMTNLNSF
jgi:hypothetical protein